MPRGSVVPFDADKLDELLGTADIDALIATSPHNTQHLLGGHRYFMYATMDSIGLSRYLPAVVYRSGLREATTYIGAGNEDWATDVEPLWVGDVRNVAWTAAGAAHEAARAVREHGPARRVGVELPYLPAEALLAFQEALPDVELVDATMLLEELRAIKTPAELELIRWSSTAVVDAMLATFAAVAPGMTTAQITARLRAEQLERELDFAYCLIATAPHLGRAPSSVELAAGAALSLDSGASHRGFVADLARMGIAGDPTTRHDELLGQVAAVQDAVRAIVKPGTTGAALFACADATLADCPDRERMGFLTHGTGLVTHEAPRMTATGSPPYPATHAERGLEAGMVISIETHVADPTLGFIKLEDTVLVTAGGNEPVGHHGRGWNHVGG